MDAPETPSTDVECTTVWSFPKRGDWATHSPGYRGNWAPQIPRNLMLRYTKEGDTVLDPMVGGGTTMIECKLLNRRGIGFDINPAAVRLTQSALRFSSAASPEIIIKRGDARDLRGVDDSSVDLVVMHPPYADIVQYSDGKIPGDLSNHHKIEEFSTEMAQVAHSAYRVLRPGKYCGVLIGDTRRKGMYVSISSEVLKRFQDAGFVLKEDVIKVQHNCRMTGYWKWQSIKFNFLLIQHEHLYIFKKPR
ncbi:MAG: DNA methyltransferase [Armatimonadota bacterium]